MSHSACIVGCMGTRLGDEERAFFRDVRPWGFILFARNVGTSDELRALTDALRAAVDDEDTLIFVDQEGGRVQRLRPPLARKRQPAAPFGALYAPNPQAPVEAVKLNHRLLARELRDHGLNADCAPCVDLLNPEGHGVIGDRAFGADVEAVSALGRAACEGLLGGGVAPVIKHIPGHGRARVDSHRELPVVETPLDTLDAADFAPFRALNDAPMAMTAHVVYAACDADNALTVSKTAIAKLVRNRIGFDGLLMSDDLSMNALGGDLASRAARSIAAGCDVVLHGNGALVGEPVRDLMAELSAVAANSGELAGEALRRAHAARDSLRAVDAFDIAAAEDRLASLGLGAAA